MTEVSATNAVRHFAELLDAVEHNGDRITIIRRGRAVAHIEPVAKGVWVGREVDLEEAPSRRAMELRFGNDSQPRCR